ncbi:hypothetical protein [Methylobacter sp. YRD-M1]|uniref:hypothetical protein n=1 Tax=Methylobacter sp. YRD-M1 TaxID=2911520 RepID=UPI00227C57C5|nr:hypothetical protein [Methylobacter sp. YRD-M1]WAK04049.1 hypothetical protein LZ558_09755 [Methylobacter sp. YRD-M1]
MNIKKIVLSVLLLLGGILIIRSGIGAISVTAPETATQARVNMPQNVNMIDDRSFDMPGSGNCAGCHAQPGRSAEAMVSPPVIYDQYIQRI